MFVVNIINSIVGKPGNIGYRFLFVQDLLDERNVENYTLARGTVKSRSKTFTLGLLSFIPRGLHYLRRNYFKRINTRKIDIKMFEFFTLILFPYLIYKSYNHKLKVVYLVELSPFIIKLFKSKGFKIILDIPIAPNNYVKNVIESTKTNELIYHTDLDCRERMCCRLADKILVPSDFVFSEIKKLDVNTKKLVTIPFGSKPQLFKECLDNKDGIDFVFAGNVSARKGINFLLDAWNIDEFDNDRLHLCGNVTRDIKLKIESLDRDNISLPGFVTTSDFFSKCDVYIFPSLMEGSSKSVYEAMNSGLACIVTHQSGSIVENGIHGIIISAFSTSEIREALLLIKSLDYKAMGLKAREKSKLYTWDLYSKRVLAEIESV